MLCYLMQFEYLWQKLFLWRFIYTELTLLIMTFQDVFSKTIVKILDKNLWSISFLHKFLFVVPIIRRNFLPHMLNQRFFLYIKKGLLRVAFQKLKKTTLRKKCPYSRLLWSVFSRIRTEYGEIRSISPYSVRIRENADQTNYTDTFHAV